MRRDYFTLQVSDTAWVDDGGEPTKPTVTIEFEGPVSTLRERLTGVDDEDPLDARETDVAFRLQTNVDADDARGVVSVTNRVTGDFILELNEDADDVLRFIRAARRYGESDDGDGLYTVDIEIEGEQYVTYEKRTFLVYDQTGELLRGESLIPSGVEL
ncbi:DUF5793 family protein [Haloarchaeobius sp. DFWS5]|uniref:DUF5793 family protein n=1 Tax=Haloarchaeobius sp. DFWS5 TaxID=3446114 RepID=UPI003EBB5AF1